MATLKMFEFRRQLFHLSFGIALVLLISVGLFGVRELWLLFLMGLIISLVSTKYRIPYICNMLDYFERFQHRKIFPGQGALFYVLGSFLVLILFTKDIALASIMILAVGDSVSHLAGRFYGRIRHPLNSSKFLEGSLFGVVFATLGAWIFVPFNHALVGAIAGMIAEGIDVKLGRNQVDDNLLIPLCASTAIFLMEIVAAL